MKKYLNMGLSNNQGNMLFMTLISLSVSGIMMAGMMSFFTNQMKVQKQLTQKYEMMDLKNSIMSTMMKPANCASQLKAADSAIKKSTETGKYDAIALDSLVSSNGGTNTILAQKDKILPGSLTGLKVSNVELRILEPDGSPNGYKGQFEISLDPSTTVGSYKPIIISQNIISDGGATNKIVDCVSPDGSKSSGSSAQASTTTSTDPVENEAGTTWKLPGPPGMPSAESPCIVVNPKILPPPLDPSLWVLQRGVMACQAAVEYSLKAMPAQCYHYSGKYGDIPANQLSVVKFNNGSTAIGLPSIQRAGSGCGDTTATIYACPPGTIQDPKTQTPHPDGSCGQG